MKAIMDSERTAFWPRHKRRVYAQAEGFENPQRADYRRLLNFLAKNSTLCQKAILHSGTVPEFAAVRTILNRKLKELKPSQDLDSVARNLLNQPEFDSGPVVGIEDLVRDDSHEIEEILQGEKRPWDDLSDLLQDRDQAYDLFPGSNQPDKEEYRDNLVEDLFHTKPLSRGRFGRQRVNRSLSSMVIDHVLKNNEGQTNTSDIEEVFADSGQQAHSNALSDLNTLLENTPSQLLNDLIGSISVEDKTDPDCKMSIDTDSASLTEEVPISKAQVMLEEWFSAVDHSPSYFDKDYAEELAENPGQLLKQLEAIARTADPEINTPRKSKSAFKRQTPQPCHVPLHSGRRKEIYPAGAIVIKDALGKVMAVRSQDRVSITLGFDDNGNLSSFTRYNASGQIHSTGERDKHGVVVRDPSGRVLAQGESMSCDPRGCLTIFKMDGQFWCIDLVRGIHIERRILEDLDGNWSSLTALITYDGFRMATRFQELKDSYRKFGDWLSQSNSSIFRFYGRDGSMIQFNSDEELQSLRPSSMKPPGSKHVDEELRGRRKARTAWDSVHEYVSHYLAIL